MHGCVCVVPCKLVSTLDKTGWCHLSNGIISQLRLPPLELSLLVVHRLLGLAWKDVSAVAVNQVSESMSLRRSGGQVAPFEDSCLSDLHPLAGLRELGKGG